MEDIKLLEKCPHCKKNLTLIESLNTDTDKVMLVKLCLECGNYNKTEVAELSSISLEKERDALKRELSELRSK